MSIVLNQDSCPTARSLYEKAAFQLAPNPLGFEFVETTKKVLLVMAKICIAIFGFGEFIVRKGMEGFQKGIDSILTSEQQENIKANIIAAATKVKDTSIAFYNKTISPLFA